MGVSIEMSKDMMNEIILKNGSHTTREDGMCAMEAVAWLAGEPHSDRPECACPVIAEFLRPWNDGLPDDETRTRLLGPLLPRIVGTRATPDVEMRRSYLALDWLARVCAPAWLGLTPSLAVHAAALRSLDPLVDKSSALASVRTFVAAWGAACATGACATGACATGACATGACATGAARAAYAAGACVAGACVAWAADRIASECATYAAYAAYAAYAGDALDPTVAALQASALELIARMIEEGAEHG